WAITTSPSGSTPMPASTGHECRMAWPAVSCLLPSTARWWACATTSKTTMGGSWLGGHEPLFPPGPSPRHAHADARRIWLLRPQKEWPRDEHHRKKARRLELVVPALRHPVCRGAMAALL